VTGPSTEQKTGKSNEKMCPDHGEFAPSGATKGTTIGAGKSRKQVKACRKKHSAGTTLIGGTGRQLKAMLVGAKRAKGSRA